ncbi:MAG: hypothetical protein ACRBF0_03115, partial [Calditrichia bacterium]
SHFSLLKKIHRIANLKPDNFAHEIESIITYIVPIVVYIEVEKSHWSLFRYESIGNADERY